MTAILLDDDPDCNFVLTELLRSCCPQVTVLANFTTPAEANTAILQHRPDLIFLDVEMPGETGFEFLKRTKPAGEVIFVTGFEKHALQALNLSATHYLLKPVEADELIQAVEKAEASRATKKKLLHYDLLLEIVERQKQQQRPKRILLPDAQYGYELVEVEQICFLEADGSYTRFHLTDKRVVVASKNIGNYQRDLGDLFFKTHRSYLINTGFVRFLDRGDDVVVMKNGDKIPISRGNTEELLKLL